ncbi:glycine--tRNA ligase subunit beta [uncultured Roseobacter sp.]|uniref:glycine--tRNA ligase subunit beta n=1 Tax=uncultured Roseobacter sp. TaxID=114847 RepID=UPI0026162E97|nr:glycine--tRNA ligase subunit beta [uncultured Roseobacter sp.]
MPDLLIELFSEEIPARMQTRAGEDLKKLITDGLVDAGLTYSSAAAFTTPRRLTLAVGGLLAESPTTTEERKGPRADAPEKAIEGFLRGAGLQRDDLEERDTPKGPVLFAKITRQGRPAAAIVAEVLEKTIRNFPWPKSMRWGNGTLRWVRPLHAILCIVNDEAGAETVPLNVDGIISGDVTAGHRFMAPARFPVTSFDDYTDKLRRAYVVLDPAERADAIWNDATNQAFAGGLEVVEDKGLLAEVAGLVEWPVVLMGRIGADFLDLPPEVLQTSMKEHQKFFSVRNPKTGRIERFITVANRETADNGATILAGYEKVLSARLADAKFFWENDLRVAKGDMSVWLDALENVTFHNKLGTQAGLVGRMAALARELAPIVGADPDAAEEAARLAKADLSSEMIYEFPELQGLMGRYYIEASGRSAEIAAAAEEHYAPLGPSDEVPTAPVSVAVSLAEKIDKLAGFWAIDEKPTGSKDPFALRRAALGIIRIVLENDLSLALADTSAKGAEALVTAGIAEAVDTVDLMSFIHDRLKVYLRDQGVRHDVIDACIAMEGSDDLALLVRRARALSEVLGTDDGENMIQAFKRANNILTQAEEADGVEYSYGADIKFAETDEERALFAALDAAEAAIAPAVQARDFPAAMSAMAALRAPVDAFFTAVQVNADNATVRRNRLNLLSRITRICSSVADLTRIEG